MGPYFYQWLPVRPLHDHATYQIKFVKMTKLTIKDAVCAKDLAPADADTLKSPASRSGQHQLPTKAGIEINRVKILAATPPTSFFSLTTTSSPPSILTSVVTCLGGMAHIPPSQSGSNRGADTPPRASIAFMFYLLPLIDQCKHAMQNLENQFEIRLK
eukprot:TRINITY_DN2418_c0_g1_i1.p6 TRINITY_DN2418_c0_g1~~TRINITY_DN2418_c0_g1_i1.p6  ORF type:complete len:158 (+),score=14.74 TRINITY_DN2418_c0_g1_i1:1070-1543(+)